MRFFSFLSLLLLFVLGCDKAGPSEAEQIILNAPGSLAAAKVASKTIGLTWADNSKGEEGFEIERKTNNGSFAARLFVTKEATSAVDSLNLFADSTYTYRIRSLYYDRRSEFSNEATILLTP